MLYAWQFFQYIWRLLISSHTCNGSPGCWRLEVLSVFGWEHTEIPGSGKSTLLHNSWLRPRFIACIAIAIAFIWHMAWWQRRLIIIIILNSNSGSNPEWGLIYCKASITAQSLPEPSSLWGSTLGTRAAEHKSCSWGMQVDWWLQPCAVFGHSFSGISWHMPQK